MYKSGFAYGMMNIQPVWRLRRSRAVIQFMYTQTLDSLLVHMHETATDSCAWSRRQHCRLKFPTGLVISQDYAITPP